MSKCNGCDMPLGSDGGCHNPYCSEPQSPPVTDLNELERLARASASALQIGGEPRSVRAFREAADEETILALLDRLRKAEAEGERLRVALDSTLNADYVQRKAIIDAARAQEQSHER